MTLMNNAYFFNNQPIRTAKVPNNILRKHFILIYIMTIFIIYFNKSLFSYISLSFLFYIVYINVYMYYLLCSIF